MRLDNGHGIGQTIGDFVISRRSTAKIRRRTRRNVTLSPRSIAWWSAAAAAAVAREGVIDRDVPRCRRFIWDIRLCPDPTRESTCRVLEKRLATVFSSALNLLKTKKISMELQKPEITILNR